MKLAIRIALAFSFISFLSATPALAISSAHPGAIIPTASPPTPLGILLFILALTTLNLLVLTASISHFFRRSLAYDPAQEWHSPDYARRLSNVLHFLAAQNFPALWPCRCNPWSMRSFQRRLLRALRPHLKSRTADFVNQHLSLWIWLESHGPVLHHFAQNQLRLHARHHLADPEISAGNRAALLAFLNSLDQPQLQIPPTAALRLELALLQRIAPLIREHGYSLSPHLAPLDQLDNLPFPQLPCARDHQRS